MILSYTFPKFVYDIQQGIKKHTLRADPKKRWKAGMSIQHWLGSPRNNRGAVKPFKFSDGKCYSVQEVRIQRMPQLHLIESGLLIEVDGKIVYDEVARKIVENDGLELDVFREYFVPESSPVWVGRIIHFTTLTYQENKVFFKAPEHSLTSREKGCFFEGKDF